MIIVEGMDSSGKTTLIRKLSADLQLLVMNNRRLPHHAQDIIKFQRRALGMDRHFPVILDRLATISEPIYGPLCRNTGMLKVKVRDLLVLQLKFSRSIIIYCRPCKDTIFKFEEPQMEGVLSNREDLLNWYDRDMLALERVGIPVYRYDWESDDYQVLLNQVKEKL